MPYKKTLAQAFISCRLNYCNSLFSYIHHRRSDESAAVCPECGRTFDVRRSTLWPRNDGAACTGFRLT